MSGHHTPHLLLLHTPHPSQRPPRHRPPRVRCDKTPAFPRPVEYGRASGSKPNGLPAKLDDGDSLVLFSNSVYIEPPNRKAPAREDEPLEIWRGDIVKTWHPAHDMQNSSDDNTLQDKFPVVFVGGLRFLEGGAIKFPDCGPARA